MLQSGCEELTQNEKEIDNQLSYTSITPNCRRLSPRLLCRRATVWSFPGGCGVDEKRSGFQQHHDHYRGLVNHQGADAPF